MVVILIASHLPLTFKNCGRFGVAGWQKVMEFTRSARGASIEEKRRSRQGANSNVGIYACSVMLDLQVGLKSLSLGPLASEGPAPLAKKKQKIAKKIIIQKC